MSGTDTGPDVCDECRETCARLDGVVHDIDSLEKRQALHVERLEKLSERLEWLHQDLERDLPLAAKRLSALEEQIRGLASQAASGDESGQAQDAAVTEPDDGREPAQPIAAVPSAAPSGDSVPDPLVQPGAMDTVTPDTGKIAGTPSEPSRGDRCPPCRTHDLLVEIYAALEVRS